MRTPKTAAGAARNIATWLKNTPETQGYHPNVRIHTSLAEAQADLGNILILRGRDLKQWDPSMAEAEAVIIYEGGPDYWTSTGCYENDWRGVSEAAYRGELDLGAYWTEAINNWSVALYPIDN